MIVLTQILRWSVPPKRQQNPNSQGAGSGHSDHVAA